MKPEERFAELWNDYLEGDLDDAGQHELRALLAGHPSLQAQATDLYQLHRLLGFAGAASETDSASFVADTLAHLPRSSDAFVTGLMQQVQKIAPLDAECDAIQSEHSPSLPADAAASADKIVALHPSQKSLSAAPLWHRREWLAAAAALTVTAIGGAVWLRRRLRPLAFARVTQNAGAVLTHSGHPLAVTELLPAGPLTLLQGSLGLRYGRGVQVVIEAPAEFECRNADSVLLHSGRLAAHVPPEAVGFAIETPRGQVIDRGTRFAIDTTQQSATQVHVFEGKVDALAHDSTAAPRRLVTGEALNLAHESETLQLRDGAFVHPEELPDVVAGLRVGQHQRWLTWRQTVQDDPSLILFAELDPQRLAHGPGAERMTIAGTRPVQGRWPGKTCLDFSRQGDAVKLDVGGQQVWPQLTLAAWVRLDRLGEPYQSLYHTDDWQRGRPGQLHWMITRSAKMRLALQGNIIQGATPEQFKYADADSSIPVLPERGRWVHLAVVYNSEAQTARFFLNGNFDNEVRHNVAHPAQLGSAQIGNWNKQDRKLSGRFDEILILGRALADEAVQAIHAAGNPYA